MNIKFLIMFMLLSLFCFGQIEHPMPQRVIDKQFVIQQGVESGGLMLDGITTVRGWDKGCEEAGSLFVHTGQTGRVALQLGIEKGVLFAGDYFLKRSIQRQGVTSQRWVWKIPGYIFGGAHAAAGIHNIVIGCG